MQTTVPMAAGNNERGAWAAHVRLERSAKGAIEMQPVWCAGI
jgi:hypothetical protein